MRGIEQRVRVLCASAIAESVPAGLERRKTFALFVPKFSDCCFRFIKMNLHPPTLGRLGLHHKQRPSRIYKVLLSWRVGGQIESKYTV